MTYLGRDRLESIQRCIAEIKATSIPGNFLEFGVALGGSAICIASQLGEERRFVGFDVFGMIPAPGDKDGPIPKARYDTIASGRSTGLGGQTYYGYMENLKEQVIRNFDEFDLHVDTDRIRLVHGLFEDTLPYQAEMLIAIAHIDCDWHDPVLCCLEYVTPRLSTGGLIILDDYHDWPGCKIATDEFCALHPDDLEVIRLQPHAVLRKI